MMVTVRCHDGTRYRFEALSADRLGDDRTYMTMSKADKKPGSKWETITQKTWDLSKVWYISVGNVFYMFFGNIREELI